MQTLESQNKGLFELCRRCAGIDFSSLLAKPSGPIDIPERRRRRNLEDPPDGVNLGRIAQSTRGHCPICDFFLDILPAKAKEGDNSFYSYRLQSRRYELNRLYLDYRSTDTQFMMIPSTDGIALRLRPIPQAMPDVLNGPGIPFIFAKGTTMSPLMRELYDRVDFDIPRQWMNLCSSLHKRTCCSSLAAPLSLKLIDCQTRCIVSAHDVEYLTLSYVWGIGGHYSNDTTDTNATLPDGLPQTIEDAITVTIQLNYRYLWIDKYCIAGAEDLQYQIRQMDSIYQNSVLTIVDAVGSDPHQGLPGVRPGSRSPHQPSVRIGELELVSTMQRPEWDIETSPWCSRGWTFQEDLLSPRLLIFTSQQIVFECTDSSFCEVFALPTFGRGSSFVDEDTPILRRNRRNTQMYRYSFDIYTCLADYSRRSLTHDYDIINATLGFFRHTESIRPLMFHLWGLPFRPDGPQLSGFLSSQQREPSILDSLRWTLKSPSLRREGFPSWSWAGWFGEITWPKEFNSSSDHFWKSKRDLVPIDISVETVDGKILPFDVFRQNYAALSPSSSYLKPIIRVSALTRNATRLVADHDNALFEPRFIIDGGGRRIIRVSTHVGISGSSTESVDLFSRDLAIFTCVATTKEFLDVTDSYLAIFLAVQELEFNVASTKYRIELMIVKQKRAIWERVALGKIDIDGSENHNIVDGISSESRREIVLG